jgi:hypothetical protein
VGGVLEVEETLHVIVADDEWSHRDSLHGGGVEETRLQLGVYREVLSQYEETLRCRVVSNLEAITSNNKRFFLIVE